MKLPDDIEQLKTILGKFMTFRELLYNKFERSNNAQELHQIEKTCLEVDDLVYEVRSKIIDLIIT